MHTTHECGHSFIYWITLGFTALTLIAVIGVNIFQGYIRWTINQNFTLLGGSELEVLSICGFALLFLLTRPQKA